jgi:LacI family transcriptional regulator
MVKLGSKVDALGVVAAEHPRITQAIEHLAEKGVPTFALISALTAGCGVGYVGLDNWKLGRTSGWAIAGLCKKPGRIGIIVGSHRYRCQELNEIGFRSYFREHAPQFQLLEPMSSLEDRRYAEEMTRDLLKRAPDLVGLYIAGGGITGVMQVLRETGAHENLVTVGYELMEQTRSGLLDGILTLVLSHPMKALAASAADAMAEATTESRHRPLAQVVLPFEFYTAENV